PRHVPPALINAANRLWEVALTEAAARHQKDLAEMQQRGREANDRVRAADQARLETEMRCDALRRENRRLEEFCEQLKRQVDDEIVQRHHLEAKNDRLTEQLRVLAGGRKHPRGTRRKKPARRKVKKRAVVRPKTTRARMRAGSKKNKRGRGRRP
ncbi:MAG: hypothetical protein Q7N50_13605, partial [Armatimonadota bacterium]|nr:hypothetical protein [Armatimonadota bacterium]